MYSNYREIAANCQLAIVFGCGAVYLAVESTTESPSDQTMEQPAAINPYLLLVSNDTPKRKLVTANHLFYSRLSHWENENTFRWPGLKYVCGGGTEYYEVNGKTYKVTANQFLISDCISGCRGFVESREEVKGIVIDIGTDTIKDAFAVLAADGRLDIDQPPETRNDVQLFFEHVNNVSGSALKNRLEKLEHHLLQNEFTLPFINEEWFLETAAELVLEQYGKWQSVNRLGYRKNATKTEIIRRLLRGKEYMNDHFMDNPVIGTIAREAGLSEFHFFRSFKTAFGITPHQYMLNRKMEYAQHVLGKQKQTVSEVAVRLGFADTAAFSNAFRKRFGTAPSRVTHLPE